MKQKIQSFVTKPLIRWLWLSLALPCWLLQGCSGPQLLNSLSNPLTYDRYRDLSYGPQRQHILDVYQPKGAKPYQADHPVIVFFYGGSWNRGDKADYVFVAEALASRGYVVVMPNYRVYPEVRYPDFLRDGAMATRWVLDNIERFGGRRDQLFVMGHSAGAYNAAMLAVDPRWLSEVKLSPTVWRGWIGIAGPYDFYPINIPEVRPVFFHPTYPPQSQPFDFFGPSNPPALLLAPREDVLIDTQRNTLGGAKRLRERGAVVREIVYDKVDHALIIGAMSWPLRFKAPILRDIDEFVKETLSQTRPMAKADQP